MIKKLCRSSLIALLVIVTSVCVNAAGIDSLSVLDSTLYAHLSVKNARLYMAQYDNGALSDISFSDTDENGDVTLPVNNMSEYKLFVWDKTTLSPISASYKLINNKAYIEGSVSPVPDYEFDTYTFNQDDNVMIVSSISETEIKGFVAGNETSYTLSDSITVLGISESIYDVVPGSVILIGTNKNGECAAIELLASIGIPVSQSNFEDDFGVYPASDGSTKYKNIITELYSKSGSVIKTYNSPDTTKSTYVFNSLSTPYYRVGIAMNGNTPVITITKKTITTSPGIFEATNKYHNYIYLRYDTSHPGTYSERQPDGTYKTITTDGVVTECVLFCVPKDFNPGAGDDEYSGIFSLNPIIIIE